MCCQAQAQLGGQVAALRRERAELERELARHHAELRQLAADANSDGTITAKLADLNERVARAETRISALRDQNAAAERKRVDEDDMAAALDGFDELWDALSPREQARVLALLVSRIEFDAADESIAVTFHPSAAKVIAAEHAGEAA